MRKISFVWSCFVMTFFVACQQAEVENPKADDLRMSIVASINGQSESPESRYIGTDPSNVIFKAGDNIGLFVDDKPAIEWIYGNGGWNPNGEMVYWPNKNEHTFRAFYPYAEANDYTSVPMPKLLNQDGSFESISACDFLVANKTQSYGDDGIVEFTGAESSFKHVSTLLKLKFKEGADLEGAILNKVTIEGSYIVSPSYYSFENDGTVTLQPDDASDVLTATDLAYGMSGEETLYFIVNEIQNATTPFKISVEYTVNEKSYMAQMSGFANNSFVGGMCQSYTITIQNNSLVISGAEISPWGVGESLDDIVINGEEIPASV